MCSELHAMIYVTVRLRKPTASNWIIYKQNVVNSEWTFAIVSFLLAVQTYYTPGTQIICNVLLNVFIKDSPSVLAVIFSKSNRWSIPNKQKGLQNRIDFDLI